MKLNKRQLAIVDKLQAGGWIWTSGETAAYLAETDAEGRVTSSFLHQKTFQFLKDHDMIKLEEDGKYRVKLQ